MVNIFTFISAQKWRTNLCAVLLGAMLTLAFAPFGVFPLAILSLTGLLALWLNTDRWRAFRLGWLFGMGLFTTGVYWIYISIHDIGDVPMAFSLIITGALISAMALFPAFVGYYLNRLFPSGSDLKMRYAFPIFWTLGEYARTMMFSGFPWLLVGYSQTNSPLKSLAPLLSVYGVTIGVTLTSGLLLTAILKFQQKQSYNAYLNLLAIAFIWTVCGALNLKYYTEPKGEPIKVSLVQGDIAQTIKWSPEHVNLSLERYESLTTPLWGKDQLIIWPEAAIPLPLHIAQDYVQKLDDKARQAGSHLFIGIPIQAPEGNGYYNAIATLGDTRQVYLKRHLVPFGEYVPVPGIFAKFFDFLKVPLADMMPGKISQPPLSVGDIKILPAICYEVAYPELMHTRDSTIGVLLTVTNDAWFGESIAQAQHLQMAAMRAIEDQRPMLFASNDGITAIIGPDGNIQQSAPPHQVYVLQGKVQPRTGLTPWMSTGLDPLFVLMMVMFLIAYRHELRTRKNTELSLNKMTEKA